MFGFEFSFYLFLIALFFGLFVLSQIFKIVPQSEEWTVERLGKFTHVLGPGLNIILPFIDRIGVKVSRRERVIDVPPQDVITKDNAMVRVDGVVFFRVLETAKAAYEVANLREAIINLTMTNIRTVIGDIELDGVLSNRDKINHALMNVIDSATDPWGVKIIRIEIKDITPATDLVEAMAQQMKAERVKRAHILEAEGFREAAIQKARGEREAAVLTAEGKKKAAILIAEADKQKRILEAEAKERTAMAEAKATDFLSESIKRGKTEALNFFVAKDYIKALKGVASSRNNKLVFMPLEASNVIGALGGIAEIAKGVFPKNAPKKS